MQKRLLNVFFALTLATLFSNILTSQNVQLKIYSEEIDEVTTSPKTQYLFIGEELTKIKSIISQAHVLSKDASTINSLDQLLNRYKQGFKTAPQDLVIAALEEAELLIEKEHESFDDEQLNQISESFAKCCQQIDRGELQITISPIAATRGPRDPKAPGGGTSTPTAEAGTLVPIDVPSKDLFVENDLTVGGDLDIHGDTHYAGNVLIDGTLTVGLAATLTGIVYAITSIEAGPSNILNIGVTDDTATLNLGRGSGARIINIGSDNDVVNIYGDINYIQVDNLQVKDKNITINKGGGTADFAGINIEEGVNPAAGYIRTTDNRSGFDLKAPASTNKVTIMPENTDASMQILASNNDRIITERTGNNMFVGRNSGNLAFNPALATGNYGFGYETLKNLTSGDDNIGIGHTALANVREGSNNIGIGVEAGNNIRAGFSNIAIGQRALQTVTTGIFNTAIGAGALQKTIGSNNSAFGSSALINLTSGGENTGLGTGALTNLSTGSNNTALGYRAGIGQTMGSNNIYIGSNQAGVDGESNVIRIGSTSAACYIQGITGQATAATANVALVDTNSKLGTIANSSTRINTPEFIIDNTGGEEANVSLHAEVNDPATYSTTWKISAEANKTADLELTQNTTTRLTFNQKGITLHSIDVNEEEEEENRTMSGKVPITNYPHPSAPRISYGRVRRDGVKISGSNDWDSYLVAGGLNRYVIQFDPYFVANPAIIITPEAAWGPNEICIPEIDTGYDNCVAAFHNPNTGTNYQSSFFFIAIG